MNSTVKCATHAVAHLAARTAADEAAKPPSSERTGLGRVLLIEPQFVLRRTIVAVSRALGVADIQEASSVEGALPLLVARRFDVVVIDVGVGGKALELLSRLRAGTFASQAGTPVVAVAESDDCAVQSRLAPFSARATICRPFKVADLLQLLQHILAGGDGTGHVPASERCTT